MMAYNTDGAVVVIRRIFMVVRYCHERGKKEKQNHKCGNSTTADRSFPFTHNQRLIHVVEFVKKLFKKCS